MPNCEAAPTINDGTYRGADVDGGTPSAPASRVRLRRGKADQWAQANPTLADGETGRETDTGREKTGPGTWNTLPYNDVAAAEAAVGVTIALGS